MSVQARAALQKALSALAEATDAVVDAMKLLEAPSAPPPPSPPPPPVFPRQPIVCVDPGHGGNDPGAVGAQGETEKALVLAYGLELRTALARRGVKVVMTREADVFIPLGSRADISNNARADAFVSVHANAAASKLANGAWVIHDDMTTQQAGVNLANKVFTRMAAVPEIMDADVAREVFPDRSPWVGGRNLAVVSQTACPAILVELGFMTNEDDLRQLEKPDQRARVVEAIAEGVLDFLKEVVR